MTSSLADSLGLPPLPPLPVAGARSSGARGEILAGEALVVALAGAAGWFALRDPALRLSFDTAVLRLPLLGRLLRDLHAARMSRTLGTMVASRLPLLEGLALTASTIHNRRLRAASDEIVNTGLKTCPSVSGPTIGT